MGYMDDEFYRSHETILSDKLSLSNSMVYWYIKKKKPCFCKSRVYDYIRALVGKLMVYSLYYIEKKIVPDKNEILDKLIESLKMRMSISARFFTVATELIRLYYDSIFHIYVDDIKRLHNHNEPDDVEEFMDNILFKFLENMMILVSGINVKCNGMCIGKCEVCNKCKNSIRFYILDEFIDGNSDVVVKTLDLVKSECQCASGVTLILDGRFIYNENLDVDKVKNMIDMIKNLDFGRIYKDNIPSVILDAFEGIPDYDGQIIGDCNGGQ